MPINNFVIVLARLYFIRHLVQQGHDDQQIVSLEPALKEIDGLINYLENSL